MSIKDDKKPSESDAVPSDTTSETAVRPMTDAAAVVAQPPVADGTTTQGSMESTEVAPHQPPQSNHPGRTGVSHEQRQYGSGAGHGYATSEMYNGYASSGRGGPRTCYNCGETGHIARDCTVQRVEGLCREVITKSKSQYRRCFNCGKMGHMSAECTIPPGNKACYQCGQEGHITKDCPNPTTAT